MMSDLFDSMNAMNDKMMGLVNGVYIGIVTNNNDPENLGRIKVKIPVIDDQAELDWARMATMMAGNDRGSMFIPEVGDEVLIAFQMGDIREPIIIGALWNKKNPPPSGKDAQNNIRKIRSRAGHEVILDDKKNQGSVTIKTAKGQQIELLEQSDTIKLKDAKGQNTVTIKGSEIELKSGMTKLMINNKGDVEISSQKGVTLKSTQVSIEATATMNLKANGSLNLTSNGILQLKGSIVKIN